MIVATSASSNDPNIRLRGADRRPSPPRDIQVQSGARKVLLTWKLPEDNQNLAKWRIYRDTESNLVMEVADLATRQMFIDASSGANPPVYNFFVSSLSITGAESVKVQVQGSAIVEASAPADPSVPPSFTEEPSGGGDLNPKGGGGRLRIQLPGL